MNSRFYNILALTAFSAIPFFTSAQTTPEFFVTWRAGSYVSPSYQGKILPIAGTPIEIGFELIDGGKIADISKNTVNWILNGKKIASGAGLKATTFATNPLALTASPEIKIVVDNYKGSPIQRFLVIPIARPEVVIRSPYPGNVIAPGTNKFDASFYYWNIASPDDIGITWSLNNEKTGGSARNSNLVLTIPDSAAGTSLNLKLSAKNLLNEFEFADDSANLAIIRL